MFSGTLGRYPHRKVHLQLVDNAEPTFQRAYSCPRSLEDAYKAELQRLCELGVLAPCGGSEWAAPSFLIPKKDKTVRMVTDFRVLNRSLKRRNYPLPRIIDLITKRKGYTFFTKLDISMMFYCLELDEESQQLCVTNTPFG